MRREIWAMDRKGFFHMVPKNDVRMHEINGAGCWCRPQRDEDRSHILIHYSLDGHELIEAGERMVQ